MKKLLILYLAVLPQLLLGQEVMKANWKTEAPLLISGASLLLASYFVGNPNPYSIQELNELSVSGINRIDLPATKNYNPTSSQLSDYVFIGTAMTPFLLFANKQTRKEWLPVTLTIAEATILTAGLTQLTKKLVKRNRPFLYNPNAPGSIKTKSDARLSFFSGHTSCTATLAFVSAGIASNYIENSSVHKWLYISAATITSTVAYLRYHAGKHYPTDVVVGGLAGAAIGTILPKIRKVKQEAPKAQFSINGRGACLVYSIH